MRSILRNIAALTFAGAATAAAQGPGPQGPGPQGPPPGAGARGPGVPAAQMLLAQTGELELTDAQVVRLAAIARRAEARRRAMQAAMDSARTRFEAQPADSVARRQFRQRMQADMQRAVEQRRIDQRDAIAVLTPDQQAKAWDMVAQRADRGRGMRRPAGPRGGPGFGPRMQRRGGMGGGPPRMMDEGREGPGQRRPAPRRPDRSPN